LTIIVGRKMALLLEEEEFERIIPFVTWILIGLNIVVFVLELYHPWIIRAFCFVPADFFMGRHLETLITYMFIHEDILHLLVNMYFLWVFCDDLENVYGHGYFIFFYLASGVGGAIVYAVLNTGDPFSGTIGASGAIFGAMAAYAIFFPRRKLLIVSIYTLEIDAWKYAVIYAIIEFLFAMLGIFKNVAHTAHLGGFLTGTVIGYVYKVIAKPRIYRTPQKPW